MGITGVTGNWDSHHLFCIIGIPAHAKEAILIFYVYSKPSTIYPAFPFADGHYAKAITWGLTILTMTVLGIRRNELPKCSPLSSALFTQGVGYVLITLLTCVPMGVRGPKQSLRFDATNLSTGYVISRA